MVCSSVVWCVLMWCGVDGLGCGLEWFDVMCGSVVFGVDVVWIGMMWCGVVCGWVGVI